jgi:uncharacterized protein (TIGR02594 family)
MGRNKRDLQMHSNLGRLTSMLMFASAITLVGANSPAQARHYVQASAFAVEQSGWVTSGTTGWNESGRFATYTRHGQRHSYGADSWHDVSPAYSAEAYENWGSANAEWGGTQRRSRHKTRVASLGKTTYASSRGGGSDVVAEARRWIGTNPTGWNHVWCGRFMNFVLERTGRRGTGSNLAFSFAHYGSRVFGPQVGAIAVMGRRGGGHVGIVSGIDGSGNPIIISGNFRNRVAEVAYPRSRIVAYVMP